VKKLNYLAPLNSLSYGVCGINFLKCLTEAGINVAIFNIGGIELTDQRYRECVQTSLNNQADYDPLATSLRLFHQFSLAEHVGKGKHVGYIIFELESFNKRELHHLRSQDDLIVCSKWARSILDKYGLKSHVVPLGVDIDVFFPTKSSTDKDTVFLNLCKYEQRKGHDILIEAFCNAFEPTDAVKLVMVPFNPFIGEDGNKEWNSYYKMNKMGHRVTILPRLSTQQEIAQVMNNADCGVFPSRAEGWNLPLLEMMACGKHLIATNYSGHTEFVTKENCHLIEVESTESAFDGVFFFNQGNWASFGEHQMEQLIEHMRAIHRKKQDGSLGVNQAGLATAQQFTWANATEKLIEAIL
jgi:glycosyltransferase involved in cell wall biosynthesis